MKNSDIKRSGAIYIKDILSDKGIDLDCSRDDLKAVLKTIKNNELLCNVATSVKNRLTQCEAMVEGQKAAKTKFCEDIGRISQALESRNLKFFMMKTIRSYPYVDDDIDLICVEKGRFGEYTEALKGIGYSFVWNRSMLREPGKYFFINKEAKGQGHPAIHLHRRITWNGIEFLDMETIWSRLRPVNIPGRTIMAPSIEDEILIAAAHSFHENTYVTAGELFHIKGLLAAKEGAEIGLDYMFEMSKRYNWDRALKEYLSYIEACYECLTGTGLFPESIKAKLGYSRKASGPSDEDMPPYFVPVMTLLPGYVSKISRDLIALKIFKCPREIFTFGLIVWLFRIKKRNKFFKNGKS